MNRKSKPVNVASKNLKPTKSGINNSNEVINSSDSFSSFNSFIKGKEFYLLLILSLLGTYFVFSDFISLKKVYLFRDIGSDSINIYFPWLIHTSDYLKNEGLLTWTFAQGMGQNMYPGSIGDLFSNMLSMLQRDIIAFGIIFAEISKLLLAGIFFYNYLKLLKASSTASILGAFCFAFSGYIILGGGWTIFSNEALYVAIILYGFELYLQKNKFYIFIIGLFLVSILQPFFLFMYALFLAVYLPVRYIDENGYNLKKLLVFASKVLGFSIVAIGISSFQLLPIFIQYIESPRVGGEAGLSQKLSSHSVFGFSDPILRFTSIFRSFSSDMLGTGNEFRGWQNYLEAPLFYCGIVNLVLFPHVFSFLTKQKKIIYAILIGVFILPILFPYFRYSFWAFSGDYYRTFSLVITILLLFFSVKSLTLIEENKKVNKIVLLVNSLFWLFLLLTPSIEYKSFVNSSLQGIAAFLIVVYTVIVLLLSSKDYSTIAKIALIIVVFFEMIYFSSITVNKRHVVTKEDLKAKIGYNDYTIDATKFLRENDNSFYRINKDYSSGLAMHGSINDAQTQQFFGTASYHSFNQKNYIRFLGETNIINVKDENSTRWAQGLAQRPLLLTMASSKYWLSNRPENYLQNFGYDSINKIGNVKIFKNKYYLPLGFCYENYLFENEFKQLTNFQKDIFLLKGFVIDENEKTKLEALTHASANDTVPQFSFETYNKLTSDLKQDVLTISQFKESHIIGEIDLKKEKMLFFSIPFDEGWHAKVNNENVELIRTNLGFTGILLKKGKSLIELKFEPRLLKEGIIISIVSLLALVVLLFLPKIKKSSDNG